MITDRRLREMASTLIEVPGIQAVTLGGSRARGTQHPGSDVDLGLYYRVEDLDLAALARATERYSDAGPVRVAPPGGWGPWVDGGGWLTVDGTPVDWILRNVARVREQCRRAVAGEFAFHSQVGHPLGFLDISYAGEVATCVPLADPKGVIAELGQGLRPYPEALRPAFIGNLWQARFLVDLARKGLPKNDRSYVMLCCATALMLSAHAWHAAAGAWATNEKGLVVDVATLDIDSHNFSARAERALAGAAGGAPQLATVIDHVGRLVDETTRALGDNG